MHCVDDNQESMELHRIGFFWSDINKLRSKEVTMIMVYSSRIDSILCEPISNKLQATEVRGLLKPITKELVTRSVGAFKRASLTKLTWEHNFSSPTRCLPSISFLLCLHAFFALIFLSFAHR
jgi:hypothetical protein